jgi:hypothetical protein
VDAGKRSGVVVLLGGGGDGDGDGDVEVEVGRVADGPPDLTVVEALARLQLEARRRGCSIRVLGPSPELCELLDLVGLADLVAGAGDLPLENGRQTESGEELRVEEAVEPGDATA